MFLAVGIVIPISVAILASVAATANVGILVGVIIPVEVIILAVILGFQGSNLHSGDSFPWLRNNFMG